MTTELANKIRDLDLTTRQLLADIIEDEQIQIGFHNFDAVHALKDLGLVNMWQDDTGALYANLGEQL